MRAIKNKCYIIAHRGFHRDCAENTLSAFEAALKVGADGIELDVHISRDDQLVIVHDPWIRPDPKARCRVKHLTLDELKRASASLLGEPMPVLAAVLDRFLSDFHWINIELKDQGARRDNLRLIIKVGELLRGYPSHKIIISSFNPFLLREIKIRNPKLKTGFLMQPRTVTSPMWQFWLRHTQADFYHPRYDWYIKNQALDPHPHISLWTLDQARLFETEVEKKDRIFSIITDCPDRWLSDIKGHVKCREAAHDRDR